MSDYGDNDNAFDDGGYEYVSNPVRVLCIPPQAPQAP
jgi:hypothetical protein